MNFRVLMFWYYFGGQIIDISLMYIFNLILMDGKSTQLQHTSFDGSLKEKEIVVVLVPLIDKFSIYKNQSHLAVFFQCNLILMYFFKVISFHLEISYVIIQCLRTVTLICLQSQCFSAHILWKFSGNGQRRCPFSVKCRFMKTFMKVFPFQ